MNVIIRLWQIDISTVKPVTDVVNHNTGLKT